MHKNAPQNDNLKNTLSSNKIFQADKISHFMAIIGQKRRIQDILRFALVNLKRLNINILYFKQYG